MPIDANKLVMNSRQILKKNSSLLFTLDILPKIALMELK